MASRSSSCAILGDDDVEVLSQCSSDPIRELGLVFETIDRCIAERFWPVVETWVTMLRGSRG